MGLILSFPGFFWPVYYPELFHPRNIIQLCVSRGPLKFTSRPAVISSN